MITILRIDSKNHIHFKFNVDMNSCIVRVKCDNFDNPVFISNYDNVNIHTNFFISIKTEIVPQLNNPYIELEYEGNKYKEEFKFNSTDLKEYSLISNSCLGWRVYEKLNSPYNSPLIGNLILNDEKYIRMCEHIESYLDAEMTFGDIRTNEDFKNITGSDRAINDNLNNMDNYPVSHHLDIDIHWIHSRRRILEFKTNGTYIFHENEQNDLIPLDEFKQRWDRRVERSKETKKICLWSASEMYNLHGNWKRKNLIERFKNLPHPSIFLTERKEEEYEDDLHIVKYITEWENNNQIERGHGGVVIWGEQKYASSHIVDILKQKFL